jgi:hypothetical protein
MSRKLFPLPLVVATIIVLPSVAQAQDPLSVAGQIASGLGDAFTGGGFDISRPLWRRPQDAGIAPYGYDPRPATPPQYFPGGQSLHAASTAYAGQQIGTSRPGRPLSPAAAASLYGRQPTSGPRLYSSTAAGQRYRTPTYGSTYYRRIPPSSPSASRPAAGLRSYRQPIYRSGQQVRSTYRASYHRQAASRRVSASRGSFSRRHR